MIHVNKTFPACSVVAVVFVCRHRFHRHLDLCGMFDKPLCRKIVAMYVLRRKGKIAAQDIPLQYNNNNNNNNNNSSNNNNFIVQFIEYKYILHFEGCIKAQYLNHVVTHVCSKIKHVNM